MAVYQNLPCSLGVEHSQAAGATDTSKFRSEVV